MSGRKVAWADAADLSQGLERYMPPCTREECARAGRPHRDVLPHQQEFILAEEKYLAMLGGFGAAKTLTAAVLGVLLSSKIRHNRGFVGRRTYSKLHDSTLPIYLDVLGRAGIAYEHHEMRDGFPHRITLPNESTIVFRETKDLGRWLGPEYGWFHLDEASEEPDTTFVGLQGRLRLPQAARYLKGFITTNPPHHTSWIAKMFGPAPGVSERGGSHYRLWQIPSTANPFLPPSYLADLRANHPESEVRRIIEGQYGFSFEGKAVYMPPFEYGKHVAELKPQIGMTVVRSWDFGYRSPAVTWHQFPVCAEGTVHWLRLHEFIGENLESEDLANIVVRESRLMFPDHTPRMFLDCGDRAGAQHSEKGPGPIVRLGKKPHFLRFRHRNIPSLEPGLNLIRTALSGSCECGRPVFQIARTCGHGIATYAGGYHYPGQSRGLSTAPSDKPKKDGFHDNLADADRYAAENYYRGLLRDPHLLDALVQDDRPRPRADEAPWDWMERLTEPGADKLIEELARVKSEGGF